MTRSHFAFLDAPGPIAFAHQGGASEFPENTLAAFQASVALGYRYIETDVQATADGVVVVMHDKTLDRTTDHAGTISNLPWSVVSQARVHGTEPVPRLDDVLAALPETRFNIEPKTDHAVDPLIDAIRRASAIDRVCLGSFKDARIRRLRRALGASLCTGMGEFTTARLRIGAWIPFRPLARLVARTDSACAQLPVKFKFFTITDRRVVSLAHDLGLAVHVWTIDDPAEMHRLLDLGVDGIMTDAPSVLKKVLVERGQWPS